jgi:YgiT-type zinc finger domain-containing protein
MTKTSNPVAKANTKPDQIIEFAIFDTPGFGPVPIIIRPEDDAWSDTVKKLAELQVNKWRSSYCDPEIMDGQGWYLTIRSPELKKKSSGSNDFPPNFDAVREIIEHAAATAPAKLKTSYARKPRKCPSCGHTPIASILYGMPNISDELFEKERRGEVIFGGCVIELDQPTWQCSNCGAEFFKANSSLFYEN